MTLLDERPAASANAPVPPLRDRASIPTWRLAMRLALRETRRRPGRTILAGLLIAAPVMAMTIGSLVARTEQGDWADRFRMNYGDADIVTSPRQFGFLGGSGTPNLPSGTEVREFLWTDTSVTPAAGQGDRSLAWWMTMTDVDLTDATAGGPVDVIEGRAPRVGEILIDSDTATRWDVSIGDELALERPSGTWTVSGIGRNRDYHDNWVVVIPGFDRDRIVPDSRSIVELYDLPEGATRSEIQRLAVELGGVTRYTDPYDAYDGAGRGIMWGYVAGVLSLVAVGIIVAAAFATSARRQLVAIGQLVANGAAPSVVRRMLVLQGTWTGGAGAIAGVAAGLALMPVARPIVARLMNHDMAPTDVRVLDLVVIAITATLAGSMAAAVPARSAARVPVMSALAGRRPLGAPPHWLVPTGLALVAGGLGLVTVAGVGINGSRTGNGDDMLALVIVAGVVGVMFGMCCATPSIVAHLGRLGSRSGLSWRMALRSLARARSRSAAVVAAIAVAVGGSVALAAIVEASVRDSSIAPPLMPADKVVIDHVENPLITDEPVDLEALSDVDLPLHVSDRLARVVPGAVVEPLLQATVDPPLLNPATYQGPIMNAGPIIATDAYMATIGLSDADVRTLAARGALAVNAGWVDETDPSAVPGVAEAVFEYPAPSGSIEITAGVSAPAQYAFAGNFGGLLLTEERARELGFDIVRSGFILRAPDPLTRTQRDQLRAVAESVQGTPSDAFIEPGDPPRTVATAQTGVLTDWWNVAFDEPDYRQTDERDLWLARATIATVALLLSLLVVTIGLALAAAEGRDERDVLAVVGARPSSLRRQAAARAAVLALTGISLGIPFGYAPAWVVYGIVNGDDPYHGPIRFPLLLTGSLVVLVPITVATAAWAGSGIAQRIKPVRPTRRA